MWLGLDVSMVSWMNSWKRYRFVQCMDDAEMEELANVIGDIVMCPEDHNQLEIWITLARWCIYIF